MLEGSSGTQCLGGWWWETIPEKEAGVRAGGPGLALQGGELGLSQLPRGRHLEKSSTLRLRQHLLPAGLGHTRRGSATTGMANTTHVGATPINEQELPEMLW